MNRFFFFALLLCWHAAAGQATFERAFSLGNSYSLDEDPQHLMIRYSGNRFYNLVLLKNGQNAQLIINRGALADGIIAGRDTISGLPPHFRLKDFIASDDFIFVCGSSVYFYYKPGALEASFVQSLPDTTMLPFQACAFLSGSSVLLYCIYNFHPCDGYAGVQLSVLDLASNTIVQKKRLPFPAIGLSHLSTNWLATAQGKVYIVDPLTASISVLDKQLNLVDTLSVKGIFNDRERDSNVAYLHLIDRTLKNEWKRIDSLKQLKMQPAAACKSDIYGKSFIYDVLLRTRSKFSFIEFITAVDDHQLAVVVSRPQYDDDYKDLYFFDTQSNKLAAKAYTKWPVSRTDTPKKADDYFIVSLLSSKLGFPYFQGNTVYSMSLVDPGKFNFDASGDFEKRLYDYYNQHGYTPTIIKSRF